MSQISQVSTDRSHLISVAQKAFLDGDLDRSQSLCQQMLQQDLQQVEVLELMGMICCQTDRFEEAIAHYRSLLSLHSSAAIHYNLGTALAKLDRFEEARIEYENAIDLEPQSYQAHYNLGNAYQSLGRTEDAIAAYRSAIAIHPEHRSSLHNLGLCLKETQQFEDAIEILQQALKLEPNHALTHNSLGDVFREIGEYDRAIAHLETAISLDPMLVEAHCNLGIARYNHGQQSGCYSESLMLARSHYETALRLRPEHDRARYNYSFLLLSLGELQAGFREYEARCSAGFVKLPTFSQPRWDGSDPTGKRILLLPEQGMGDTIQFIRYATLLRDRGATVLFYCPKPLVSLISSVDGISQIIVEGDVFPDFDCYALLLSLPFLFETTIDSIPSTVPYLLPTSSPSSIRKVGIVWGGNPSHDNDRYRSLSLTDLKLLFEPLSELTHLEFYSLQKGRSGELKSVNAKIHDLDEQLQDFADTARAIAALDLVITVDTSVAHLAGALGKPVWILLCAAPDWRWMLEREDSPWYPTARLFRQQTLGDWTEVVSRVKQALTNPKRKAIAGIGIGFPIGGNTGWGTYGLNLALQLLQRHDVQAIPLSLLSTSHSNPMYDAKLSTLRSYSDQIQQLLQQHPNHTLTTDLVMLKGLGNDFVTTDENDRLNGKANIGIIFFEDTQFSDRALKKAKQYDRIITGSTWNAEVLQRHGIRNVETVFQGIDPTIFHPAPRSGIFRDRFVIFSGGKLEYRKGQDIAIAAFKIFQSRHPEALLLTAWHNFWAQTMSGLARSSYVQGLPKVDAQGRLQIIGWLMENGIARSAVLDLGLLSQEMTAQVIREADVALFPNRAEGGTNLVAMECLACGVPTVLSSNTGHLDLIGDDRCYELRSQAEIRSNHTEGWGESDVDEIVETLELIYQDWKDKPLEQREAYRKGQRALEFMKDWIWKRQIDQLIDAIDPFL